MTELYSGTPGSGKSLHAAYRIIEAIEQGKYIIANFPIDMQYFYKRAKKRKKVGSFYFVANSHITPKGLRDFAKANLKPCEEHQCLVVLDECGCIFNPRAWNSKGRQDWIDFLINHRKYGYDILMIAQSDMLVDKQIRPLIEKEYKHRSIKNFQFFGWLLNLLVGGLFIAVEYWYTAKLKCSTSLFKLNKRKANIYNSYKIFDYGEGYQYDENIYSENQIKVAIPMRVKKKGNRSGKGGRGLTPSRAARAQA